MSEPLRVYVTWNADEFLQQFQAALPDAEFRLSGDTDEIIRDIRWANVACVGLMDAEILRAATNLKWIHAFVGGVEGYCFSELVNSDIPLTCLKGVFDIPAAEYALGIMLAFSRRIADDIRQKPLREFTELPMTELSGKTVGIVGLGNIGREIAGRCHAFGMRVIGLVRQPGASVPHVNKVFGPGNLRLLLSLSDYVIVAVPLTNRTSGLIDAGALAAMKSSALLIDVTGRAGVYDLEALTQSLLSRKIQGESLQILPAPKSPLWELDNTIISFHRNVSVEQLARSIDRFASNARRFQAGKLLLGIVDKSAGY